MGDPDDLFPTKDSDWLAANIGSGEWPSRYISNATAAARNRWREAQYAKLAEPLRSELLAA